ncbi:hypothetical protein, partial [Acinetobacter baumannii]|uniref:hypothetical protein n=1 Tax=Acinetobacter baumannii TaxID=470 RepID=UPI001C084004
MADNDAEVSIADIAPTICAMTRACELAGRPTLLAPERRPPLARVFHTYQWRNEYWSLDRIPG